MQSACLLPDRGSFVSVSSPDSHREQAKRSPSTWNTNCDRNHPGQTVKPTSCAQRRPSRRTRLVMVMMPSRQCRTTRHDAQACGAALHHICTGSCMGDVGNLCWSSRAASRLPRVTWNPDMGLWMHRIQTQRISRSPWPSGTYQHGIQIHEARHQGDMFGQQHASGGEKLCEHSLVQASMYVPCMYVCM